MGDWCGAHRNHKIDTQIYIMRGSLDFRELLHEVLQAYEVRPLFELNDQHLLQEQRDYTSILLSQRVHDL